jgi:capsular polysaccharide biosynthesis protein
MENLELNVNQPTNTAVDEDDTIDLMELFYALWQKAWILLLSLAVGALLAGLYTKFFVTPQYQASSELYIWSKTTSITSLTDLQIGSQLTEDFQILATSRPVVEQVIENLGLDTTYEELVNIVTVSDLGTRILKITVTHPDPQLAADISNEMAEALRDRVAEVTNSDRPTTVENAVVPTKKSSPSMSKNVAIGGLLGLILSGGIIVLLYLMDDTIKTNEDVERYLHLNVIATIPVNSVFELDEEPAENKHHSLNPSANSNVRTRKRADKK